MTAILSFFLSFFYPSFSKLQNEQAANRGKEAAHSRSPCSNEICRCTNRPATSSNLSDLSSVLACGSPWISYVSGRLLRRSDQQGTRAKKGGRAWAPLPGTRGRSTKDVDLLIVPVFVLKVSSRSPRCITRAGCDIQVRGNGK